MKSKGIQVMGLALGLGLAGTALAQGENKQGDLNVFLRGGVSDYTGDIGEDVQAGPAWGLTVNVQPMRIVGFELGYEGSRNDVTPDLLPDASFTRHGISGLLKLAPPLLEEGEALRGRRPGGLIRLGGRGRRAVRLGPDGGGAGSGGHRVQHRGGHRGRARHVPAAGG